MARILIDDFKGEPKRLYDLICEELVARNIPNLKMSTGIEHRAKSGGWFADQDNLPSMVVGDGVKEFSILAFQYGRSFGVTTRSYWKDLGLYEKEQKGKLTLAEDAIFSSFNECVERAVRAGLARYLAEANISVPAELDPKRVFAGTERS